MRWFLLMTFLCLQSYGQEGFEGAIDSIATKELESGGVGLTIGVAQGDQVIHMKGYGMANVELSVPASKKSVYRIGSITKMFTAAAILLLVEDGKLNLDDPLTKYIPDYPADPGDKITIRHLLTHTSGIVNFTSLPDHRSIMRMDMKHEALLARFQNLPSLFSPGEKFSYCNSGYYLLGMVIENVSEMKYEPFLKTRITGPLKLDCTTYDRHLKIIPNRAAGYARWGKNLVNAQYVSMKTPFAAGALASTAGDLIRWQRTLAKGELIKPESWKMMTTPGNLNDGKPTPYGFGCFVGSIAGHRFVRHGGGIPGFVTEAAYFPDDELSIVVLTNAGRNTPKKIADQIARLIFK